MIFSGRKHSAAVQEAYKRGVEDGRKLAAEKFGWSIFDIPDEAIAAKELHRIVNEHLSLLAKHVDTLRGDITARAVELERKSSKVGSLK